MTAASNQNFLDAGNGDLEPVPALFLTDEVSDLNEGATFLERLSMEEAQFLQSRGATLTIEKGMGIFFQGEAHNGIYLIENGRVRTYCNGPSGRELTLAYWSPGHFVGGPELFGGTHLWSGEATEDCRLLLLSGEVVHDLVERMPIFAICLIDALVAKGKCYSWLVQMLGTRSIPQRLAQLLTVLGRIHGAETDHGLIINRRITHDQIADIVGSTRQWVTSTLDRWRKDEIIGLDGRMIVILKPGALDALAIAA